MNRKIDPLNLLVGILVGLEIALCIIAMIGGYL